MKILNWRRIPAAGLLCVAAALAACASGPQTQVTQPLSESADAPYDNVLVVALFSSFEARLWLETEIVNALSEAGVTAVRSTSMMNTQTPVVPQTFIDMVKEIGADAVLLTQLTSLDIEVEEKSARARATYSYQPTYYFNVFAVELTEYVEPPRLNMEHDVLLATQMFSVKNREPVWGMDSRSQVTRVQEEGIAYHVFIQEAEAIVRNLMRDGVIGR